MKDLTPKYKLTWRDKAFLKSFARQMGDLTEGEKRKAEARFVEIFNAEADRITDEQSQGHLLMCAYVLAFYTVLAERGEDDAAIIDRLTEAFKKAGGGYVKWYMRMMLWLTRDQRKFIEESTIRSIEAFGDAFEITVEREAHQFTSVVKRCGYFDFFQRHDKPALTKVFCAWDSLWIEEVDRHARGIRFVRPTTIAENGNACRFEFHYE